MGLNVLVGAVVALVIVGIVAVFGLDLISDQREESCSTGYSYNSSANNCHLNSNNSIKLTTAELNATTDALEGVAKIPAKLPLLAGAVITVVIIALLVRYFQSK